MCFSAAASFITAVVTGGIGTVALAKVKEPRELLLAATPMVFALQQSIEGLLWLDLSSSPDGSISTKLVFLFLFFAQVFWPIFVPVAVLLIEPNEKRRRIMLLCLAAGIGAGGYLLWGLLAGPQGAIILDDHIVYVTESRHLDAVALAYLAATSLPPILSSRRTVVVLGAIILVGSVVAYAFYWEAFISVWCFFAAAASGVILFHFELSRRQRLALAGA